MNKACNKGRLIQILLITLICAFLIAVPLYSCPHFDEFGEEYYWLFYENGNSVMIYYKEHFNRNIYLDYDFNEEYEEFMIFLMSSTEKSSFKASDIIRMGNRDYWFDVSAREPMEAQKNGVASDNLYSMSYGLKTTIINNERHSGEFSAISNSLAKAEMKSLENKILSIQPKITYLHYDETPTKDISINRFFKPITISFDLSPYSLAKQDIAGLTAVSLEGKDYNPVKLKGNYNSQNKVFSFSISKPGIYGIAIEAPVKKTASPKDNIKEEVSMSPVESQEQVQQVEEKPDEKGQLDKEAKEKDRGEVPTGGVVEAPAPVQEEKNNSKADRSFASVHYLMGGAILVLAASFIIIKSKRS